MKGLLPLLPLLGAGVTIVSASPLKRCSDHHRNSTSLGQQDSLISTGTHRKTSTFGFGHNVTAIVTSVPSATASHNISSIIAEPTRNSSSADAKTTSVIDSSATDAIVTSTQSAAASITASSAPEVSATSTLLTSDLAADTTSTGSLGCTSTISSYDDVADAVSSGCDIILELITVPAGRALDLSDLTDGATVTVTGDVTFTGGTEWAGPMFIIDGSDITFNGNGHTFDGQGATYWDGKGSNGGVTKPISRSLKMMKIKMSGTFSDLIVLNTPVQAFSIGDNDAALSISGVTIDNRDGDELDSDGDALGHNTDCFDVSATSVTLTGNTCYNQDDCLAINSGSDITFENNYCSGGHGISIGSIKSDKTVSGITISGNTVVSSANGLRIKTVYDATDGSVSDITYTDNTCSGITDYGVVIEQDYENGSPTGTATNGITIKNINLSSGNTVSVEDGADQVYVLCGSGSCTGTWDWSGLSVSGGDAGSISGDPPITGFSLS